MPDYQAGYGVKKIGADLPATLQSTNVVIKGKHPQPASESTNQCDVLAR
jgi:hypothetical protein